MPARRPLEERYWEKVRKGLSEEDCWEWLASTDGFGYGWIGLGNGHLGKAHQVSWLIHFGPIPPGKYPLHKCDNPPCSNPRHLFLGTQKDNALDREAKGRGNHPRGDAHPARLRPDYLRRGDDHHLRRRPELRYWGERNTKAKLTADTVVTIRQQHALRRCQYKQLAAEYGVAPSTIRNLILRKTWPHVA